MSRRALTAVAGVVAGLVGLLFASLVAASRADDAYEAWADRAFRAAAGLGDRVDVPD